MSFASFIRRLSVDNHGSAAEFALVLPLSMLLFVGLIDAGRYAYSFNEGEKATQIGARWAVVTDPLAPELASASYTGVTVSTGTLIQGDRIPEDALDAIVCTETACTCKDPVTRAASANCPADVGIPDAAAFAALSSRMKQIWPSIDNSNIEVEYRGSGLGYAGNPDSMDIAPFVTVRLIDMDFTSFLLFGGTVGLPDFAYTLTMEDGQGTGSN